MASFGQFWSVLVSFGQFWSVLNSLEIRYNLFTINLKKFNWIICWILKNAVKVLNAYLLAKIGADTAEKEQDFAKDVEDV